MPNPSSTSTLPAADFRSTKSPTPSMKSQLLGKSADQATKCQWPLRAACFLVAAVFLLLPTALVSSRMLSHWHRDVVPSGSLSLAGSQLEHGVTRLGVEVEPAASSTLRQLEPSQVHSHGGDLRLTLTSRSSESAVLSGSEVSLTELIRI